MTLTTCSPLLSRDPSATTRPASSRPGVGIEAHGLVLSAGSRRLLDDVSLAIGAGELVAVIGASGAGKTTLLEALAGLRSPQHGSVRFTDGRTDASTNARRSAAVGYVPQDDIIHKELELDRTLLHAALLRLPAATTRDEAARDVERVLEILDLRAVAGVRVGALSGGQRKRASIAVELLARPAVCFLDEPTSGLDPATGHALTCVLRSLADAGRTVIFTTHSTDDLARCDRVLIMGRGGRLLFSGTVVAALEHFAVSSVAEIYEAIDRPGATPVVEDRVVAGDRTPHAALALPHASSAASSLRQWRVLTVRAAHTLVRNRLTLVILLGSPALVTAMFALLFRAGAFDPTDGDATAEVMVTFWIAFAAFFFGLTYGLLQVCTEIPILRRERQAGLSIWAYVLSKIALLVPFLIVVDIVMLAVLRLLDRLPAAPSDVYWSLAVTFFLDALAALCLGLVASAAVDSTAQAALALPMLCFPAVLFAGAMVPLPVMAGGGRAIATFMADRWAFEAFARDLGVRGRTASTETTALGVHPASYYWLVLAGFIVVLLAAARVVVALRARPSAR
ncbi:MAG: ATP-binding cassette domain-containing protein [Acidimicrobiales bacterium]